MAATDFYTVSEKCKTKKKKIQGEKYHSLIKNKTGNKGFENIIKHSNSNKKENHDYKQNFNNNDILIIVAKAVYFKNISNMLQ